MNERIKENWEKATGSAIPGPGFFASASDYNIEKFAELIVKETMQVVINGKYSATECERNTHRIAHNNARDEASLDIKKHFRVEE